jgi:hypothetical protein
MRLRVYFIEWTPRRLVSVVGIVLFMLLAVVAVINIGAGPTEDVRGVIRSIGMETGTRSTLPRLIATVEMKNGEMATVEIPKTVNVRTGSEVIVGKTPRLITGGHEITFIRLEK